MTASDSPLAIEIAATDRSPAVRFDPVAGRFSMAGESYPEDAAAFYGPILYALRSFLAEDGPSVTVDISLIYFNSSSAKALMNIFQMMRRWRNSGRISHPTWSTSTSSCARTEMVATDRDDVR
jgi:hypothetical protein